MSSVICSKINVLSQKVMLNQVKFAFFLLAVFLIAFPAQAYAYLDPGTGSYILQVAAAVFFAGIFVVKTWWRQIMNLPSRLFGKKNEKDKDKTSIKGK